MNDFSNKNCHGENYPTQMTWSDDRVVTASTGRFWVQNPFLLEAIWSLSWPSENKEILIDLGAFESKELPLFQEVDNRTKQISKYK